jgi:hypothetical protein
MSTATETLFQPLTIATAPEASKPILENIKKGYGFIPNLMATFANSPPCCRDTWPWTACLRRARSSRSSAN